MGRRRFAGQLVGSEALWSGKNSAGSKVRTNCGEDLRVSLDIFRCFARVDSGLQAVLHRFLSVGGGGACLEWDEALNGAMGARPRI